MPWENKKIIWLLSLIIYFFAVVWNQTHNRAKVCLLFSFYRWENEVTERLGFLSKATELVKAEQELRL